jgi:nucleoside-diphosphate-sugar epimerase
VLKKLVARAVKTDNILPPWHPIVYIEDLSRAFIAALHYKLRRISGQVFNFGPTTQNYQNRKIAEADANVGPSGVGEFVPQAKPNKRSSLANLGHIARTLPDFQPRWGVHQGTRQFYESFVVSGLTEDDVTASRYQRTSHVREPLASGALDTNVRWTETV